MSSCYLRKLGKLWNMTTVQEYLFNKSSIEKKETGASWNEDEWVENWNFDQSDEVEPKMNAETNGMLDCCIAMSPTGDFICIARNDRAVFFNGESVSTGNKHKENDSNMVMDISFQGLLTEKKGETITDVVCISLVSLKHSSHGSRDWTCVLAGFSSGFVRMYTESGALLISELFHDSSVAQLSCRTFDPTFHATHSTSVTHHDELTILYDGWLVTLEGLSLFHTLRACRNQLAVATAHGIRGLDPPPLSYKKWMLRGQQTILSHIGTGITTLSPFNQMNAESITNGFNAEIKCNIYSMNTYVTTGTSPAIGFYYAIEGNTQPLLSHVALAVASKFKSAMYKAASGFFTWASDGQKNYPDDGRDWKAKQEVELGVPLEIHSGLPDSHRHVSKIVLAPRSHCLAATCDSFGRILLIDLLKTCVLRMWKGYREAQIGFASAFGDESTCQDMHGNTHIKKSALFLIIYAPRRGILEIWSCINGPRVGTFNIGKNARLLYPGFSLFGIASRKQNLPSSASTIQCCVLEADGFIEDICIPFHLALSDSSCNKARDIHLYKQVLHVLQSDKDGEKIIKLILDMHLPSVKKQTIEKLLSTKNVACEVLKKCLHEVNDQLLEKDMKKDDKLLAKFSHAHLSLIDMYEQFKKMNHLNRNHRIKLKDTATLNEGLMNHLNISEADATHIIDLLYQANMRTLYPGIELNQTTYIETAQLSDVLLVFLYDNDEHSDCNFIINSAKVSLMLGDFLFHSSLFGEVSPADIIGNIQEKLNIGRKTLFKLIFYYWLNKKDDILQDLVGSVCRLKEFVMLLCSSTVLEEAAAYLDRDAYTSTAWLQWIKDEVCLPATNIVPSYLIALVVRTMLMESKQDKLIQEGSDQHQTLSQPATNVSPDISQPQNDYLKSGWETLYPELEQWNLMVKQFEDCLLINYSLALESQEEKKAQIPESESISINALMQNGPGICNCEPNFITSANQDPYSCLLGYIPELLAKKLCALRVQPFAFSSTYSHKKDESNSQVDVLQINFVSFLQSKLRHQFPFSLSPNSLHAHCFWEELVLWNKDPEVIVHFSNANTHLRFIERDPCLQSGLGLMGWHTFVAKRFSSLAKLIDKVGKAPKDRLCRKEVGVSILCMPEFCHCCTQLLQTIVDAHPDLISASQSGFEQTYGKVSTYWMVDDNWQDVTGKESIAELGRHQPTANFPLVQLFMNLSFVMNGIMEFTLRGTKPLTNLFHLSGRSVFFLDLTTRMSVSDTVDISICNHRQQFLFKLVKAAVSRMTANKNDMSALQLLDAIDWIETTIHMATEFLIDDSVVKMHYVCELFRQGLDARGREVLHTTEMNEDFLSQLFTIVGKRIAYFLSNTTPEAGVFLLSQMPHALSCWIREQETKDLYYPDVSLSDTILTTSEIISVMPQEHPMHAYASFALESFPAMEKYESSH